MSSEFTADPNTEAISTELAPTEPVPTEHAPTEPVPTEHTVTEPVPTDTAEIPIGSRKKQPELTELGRHAMARPLPTSPDDPTQIVAPGSFEETILMDRSSYGAGEPTLVSAPAVAGPDEADQFGADPFALIQEVGGLVEPQAPPAPGWGSRVAGTLIGLILAVAGTTALLVGQSRILAAQTDGWDWDLDRLAIGIVLGAAVVLLVTVLLASWTAAVPGTAGLLLTGLGVFAVIAPGYFHELVLTYIKLGQWDVDVLQSTVTATSGSLLLVGVLLFGSAIATAAARRRGVATGLFDQTR